MHSWACIFRGPGENMPVVIDTRNFRRLGSHISGVFMELG